MSLKDLIPSSKFGYGGKKPAQFDLGPNSTLDNTSSIDNNPSFLTYADPYLRSKVPTKLSRGTKPIPKYLDNPPT